MSEVVHAIVNPAAGGGRCGALSAGAVARLRERGLPLEVHETRAAGDATRIAHELFAGGARDFVAVGGDGTSYEVLNGALPGALERGERIALGMLPLGTGNSFLRDFTDRGAEHAIEALGDGRRRACDVVRLVLAERTVYYLNILSVGFVAAVGSLANRRFKALGTGGYGAAVVAEVSRLSARKYRLRLDGGRWWEQEAIFVSIDNSRFTGGRMMMAPYADTSDGRADVIVAGKMGRLALLRAFPRIFAGTHVHMPEIVASQAKVVELDAEPETDLMIDGEVLRGTVRRVEVLHHAIDIRV